MSDPIDRMLDAAESGKSIIKNRETSKFFIFFFGMKALNNANR